MIDGKVDECGVFLQIVQLEMNGKVVGMELSDTINKTRRIQMQFSRPQEFKLFMVLRVCFEVVKIEEEETAEKYILYIICLLKIELVM